MSLKQRMVALLVAVMAVIAGSMLVAVPSASAAPRIANPSGEWTVGCSGAWADIQVDWRSDGTVAFWWQLKDTMADGKSPVLRIWARDAVNNMDAHVFRNEKTNFVLGGGQGAVTTGEEDIWNPDNMDRINRLWIEVKSGTSDQGEKCLQQKEVFNWTRVGYANALNQIGAPYVWGGTGPGYDCSGLVYDSYNRMVNFPNWPVRTSQAMYDWARTHTDPSKFYAQKVAYSDLKIGDLIFYSWDGDSSIEHVAFYAGGGRVFDAQQEGVPVGYHDDYTGNRVAAYRILGVDTL